MQYALVLALLLPAVVLAARPRQTVRLDADNHGMATQVLTYRDETSHVEAVQAQVTLNCRAGEHRNMYEVTVSAVDSLPRSEQSRLDIKNAQGVPHGFDSGSGVLSFSGPYHDLTENKRSTNCAGNEVDGECAIELTGVAEIKQYVQVPGSVPGSLNWVGNYRVVFNCRLVPDSPAAEHIFGSHGSINLTVCQDFQHTLTISALNDDDFMREGPRSQKVVMNTVGTPYGVMWNDCHLETSARAPENRVAAVRKYQVMRNGIILKIREADVSGRSTGTPGEQYQMDIKDLTLEGRVKLVCYVKKCRNVSAVNGDTTLDICPEGQLPHSAGTRATYSSRSRSAQSLLKSADVHSKADSCTLRAVEGQL
ncbi:hypothetical protein RvY_11864 [Ramazzottius varieornatus]|uniref:ZP domain-containing protein n=1 Tax=Ramazzottius varieornatus TaxID=947166 RepID=A0A1D1VHG1_RAMVA|nr:hypothetical protein RvY_11864 [Ramazzottius varieornatus]